MAAVHLTQVGSSAIYVVEFIGYIKIDDAAGAVGDLIHLLEAFALTIITDFSQAIYDADFVRNAAESLSVPDIVKNNNLLMVIVILPETHPMRADFELVFQNANHSEKLAFAKTRKEAIEIATNK